MLNRTQSDQTLNAHLVSNTLHDCKTDTERNCALLNDTKSLKFRYQAATSHLISFIDGHKNKSHDQAYFKESKRLAESVLTVGSQLFEVYNLFDTSEPSMASQGKVFRDLHIKKKTLIIELCYCEFLAGIQAPKWQKYRDATTSINDTTLDSVIRFITAETNWYRLFGIRLKRLFTNFMPLVKSLNYHWFVYEINRVNPVLSYVAWLFYVPRLSADLYSLLIHTVPGPWMGENEKALGFSNNLSMHWERLWFEILNDAVWLAVGLACCFFLSPANSILLTAGLYFFDAGMAFTNHYFSTAHHKKLRDTLETQSKNLYAMLNELSSSKAFEGDEIKDEIASIAEHTRHINLWIDYEQQKLYLSIFVTSMFSISMAIGALPTLFTLSAGLAIACPIISACIVVAVCITQYISSGLIEKQCPSANILKLEALEEHIQEHKIQQKKNIMPPVKAVEKQTNDKKSENTPYFFRRSPLKHSLSCPEDVRNLVSVSALAS